MLLFPNAKINIGLNIISKREDGYHNIESIFYPIEWHDALECVPSEHFKMDFSGLEIPGKQEDNLIFKAYKLLQPHFGVQSEGHIHLHKVIPMGAGLGGGSADGAFALKLFNEVFECGLDNKQLQSLASQLGSDCPFFIENEPTFCFDRGIKFKAINLDLSNFHIYVVNPGIHISTKEAYDGITPSIPTEPLLDLIQLPIEKWKDKIVNDFEHRLLLNYKPIAAVKQKLYDHGAIYASMTGSGSTVYGIFEKPPQAIEDFKGLTTWRGRL